MAEALLRTVALCKSYGALRVTDDVSLEIGAGELHALIGPNGAGKTTLIHQLSGLAAPDAGTIVFAGEDVTRLSMPARARRGLARTFQITSVIEGFTALDNVALAVQARSGSSLRLFGDASRETKLNDEAMAALAEVGLGASAFRRAGALSHGEKRRLELAIAIAMRPRLLLLDEPLAGAGAAEGEELIGMLGALKARYAMLLVEHDMQAVFALADKISVLVNGRLIATGSPDAVRADPQVQAAYLGEGV